MWARFMDLWTSIEDGIKDSYIYPLCYAIGNSIDKCEFALWIFEKSIEDTH